MTMPAAASPMNVATQIARTQLPRSHTLRFGPSLPCVVDRSRYLLGMCDQFSSRLPTGT